MDIAEFRHFFTAACDIAGGKKKWADANGVSPAYVSDILSGHREPGPKVLHALGLERVVTYQLKEASNGEESRV